MGKEKIDPGIKYPRPPFEYPGAQVYALGRIIPFIPIHSAYIEPFCGSASVFFAKTKVFDNWLNDINPELIATYNVIRDNPEGLIRFIKETEDSEENYNHLRDLSPKSTFEAACRWFYLNRTSIIKMMGKEWVRDPERALNSGFWESGIVESSKKLQEVKLTNMDFEPVIDGAPDNSFIYLSPPYSIHHCDEESRTYRFPFVKSEHSRLLSALRRNTKRIKFMLTYNVHPEIRKIYSQDDVYINEIKNDPPMKRELMIRNYRI